MFTVTDLPSLHEIYSQNIKQIIDEYKKKKKNRTKNDCYELREGGGEGERGMGNEVKVSAGVALQIFIKTVSSSSVPPRFT